MRLPINKGDFVHIYNRGPRKIDIFHDQSDFEYFLYALFYLNNSISIPEIFRHLREKYPDLMKKFIWPPDWKKRDPIVRIHAFIAMPNHFHLILEEIKKGGISLFMQKFGTGLTNRYNMKYKVSGSLFQGKYKYKVVKEDNYLQNLGVYVQVKNAFELSLGGFEKAVHNFDKAFDFSCKYRFGSLSYYAGIHKIPIIESEKSAFFDIENIQSYKDFSKSLLLKRDFDDILAEIKID